MLTDKAISKALRELPKGSDDSFELSDGGPRGGGRLKITARVKVDGKGNRSCGTPEWYAVWYRGKTNRRIKLGVYPQMSLAAAREVFARDYAPAIARGEEPKGRRAKAKEAGGPMATVMAMFEAYIENQIRGKAAQRNVGYILTGPNGAANALGASRLASAICRDDVRDLLKSIRDRGTKSHADHTHNYVKAAFNWAMTAGGSYTNVGRCGGLDWGVTMNPAKLVRRAEDVNNPGTRFLTPAEIRAFWNWLSDPEATRSALAPALQLMLLTGQRPGEIIRLGANTPLAPELDEEGVSRGLYLPDENSAFWSKTKNGMPHFLPLPRQAIPILDMLPAVAPCGFYFPRRDDDRRTANVSSALDLVKLYLGVTGAAKFTPRDLRRTWKTLAGKAGISKDDRDLIQNHRKNDVSSRHYDRYDYYTEKRKAMNKWEAYFDRILAGELDAEVVSLGRRSAALPSAVVA